MLRFLTPFFLILGIALSLGFPWVVKARPHGGGRIALEHYSLAFGSYLLVTMFSFIAAAVCAIFMVRKVRESYRDQSRQNLQDLVESALRQHQKPGAGDGS